MAEYIDSTIPNKHPTISEFTKESKAIKDKIVNNMYKLKPKVNAEQLKSNSETQLVQDHEVKNKNLKNSKNEIEKKNIPRGRDRVIKNKAPDPRNDKNKIKKKIRKDLSVNSRIRDFRRVEEKLNEPTITEILYRRFAKSKARIQPFNNNTNCTSHGSTNSNYVGQQTKIQPRQPAGTEYDIISNASMQTELLEMRQKQQQATNPSNKDFIACLNVSKFKPEEIKAKIVNDSIFVEGRHDERLEQNGIIARTFSRKYVIPDGYDRSKIEITMYKDKILKIKVPAPMVAPTGPIRLIPIQHRNENAIIKKNRQK